jgi:hypothetical protein
MQGVGGGASTPPEIEGKFPHGFVLVAKALNINDIINIIMGMSARQVQISQ